MGYGATAHNRIVCAAPPYGGLAGEKPQSALCAFVRFSSGTFCPPLELLRNSFIAAVKTSHTTRRLHSRTLNSVLILAHSHCFGKPFSSFFSFFYYFFQKNLYRPIFLP
jgi:hypothetical protein